MYAFKGKDEKYFITYVVAHNDFKKFTEQGDYILSDFNENKTGNVDYVYVTDFFENLKNKDLKDLEQNVYVVYHNTQDKQENFISEYDIKLIQQKYAEEYQEKMVENSEEFTLSHGDDEKTIGETTGLSQSYDPWDNRTLDERKAEKQGYIQKDKLQEKLRNDVMGSSFQYTKNHKFSLNDVSMKEDGSMVVSVRKNTDYKPPKSVDDKIYFDKNAGASDYFEDYIYAIAYFDNRIYAIITPRKHFKNEGRLWDGYVTYHKKGPLEFDKNVWVESNFPGYVQFIGYGGIDNARQALDALGMREDIDLYNYVTLYGEKDEDTKNNYYYKNFEENKKNKSPNLITSSPSDYEFAIFESVNNGDVYIKFRPFGIDNEDYIFIEIDNDDFWYAGGCYFGYDGTIEEARNYLIEQGSIESKEVYESVNEKDANTDNRNYYDNDKGILTETDIANRLRENDFTEKQIRDIFDEVGHKEFNRLFELNKIAQNYINASKIKSIKTQILASDDKEKEREKVIHQIKNDNKLSDDEKEQIIYDLSNIDDGYNINPETYNFKINQRLTDKKAMKGNCVVLHLQDKQDSANSINDDTNLDNENLEKFLNEYFAIYHLSEDIYYYYGQKSQQDIYILLVNSGFCENDELLPEKDKNNPNQYLITSNSQSSNLNNSQPNTVNSNNNNFNSSNKDISPDDILRSFGDTPQKDINEAQEKYKDEIIDRINEMKVEGYNTFDIKKEIKSTYQDGKILDREYIESIFEDYL